MAEAVNKVGLGVDLFGGPDVLSTLRSIRSEMQGIAALAGSSKIPNNVGGSGRTSGPVYDAERQLELFEDIGRKKTRVQQNQLSQQEKDFLASEKEKTKIAKAEADKRAKISKPVTDKEVDAVIEANKRKAELAKQVGERLAQQEKQRQDELLRIEKEAYEKREAALKDFRSRVNKYQGQEGIADRTATNRKERSEFR